MVQTFHKLSASDANLPRLISWKRSPRLRVDYLHLRISHQRPARTRFYLKPNFQILRTYMSFRFLFNDGQHETK